MKTCTYLPAGSPPTRSLRSRRRWAFVLAAGALFCCVLSFYRATGAAPPADNQPFANPVQQRMEMISELRAIHALLKEQNVLLKEQNELIRSQRAGATSKAPPQSTGR